MTSTGRLVAFGLMIGGIALLGTVTATLASWLVETVAAQKEQAEDIQVMVRRLEDKIDQLDRERGRTVTTMAHIADLLTCSARSSHSRPTARSVGGRA